MSGEKPTTAEGGIPAPHQSRNMVEGLFDVAGKKQGQFLSSVLLDQILGLVAKKAPEDKIRKALKPYTEEFGGQNNIDFFTQKLLDLMSEAGTNKKTPEKDTSNLLQKLGITPNSVFFTEGNDRILVKNVHPEKNTIDIVDKRGVYTTDFKLLGTNKDGMLSLGNRGKTLRLRLASPVHTNEEAIELEHYSHEGSDEHIPVDIGDTFRDAKGNEWEVTGMSVDAKTHSVIFKVTATSGPFETRFVHVRDWHNAENKDIIKTLGDQLTLSREREPLLEYEETEPASETETQETATSETEPATPQEKQLKSIKYPTSEGVPFDLRKGVAYTDDDKIPWEVVGIVDHGNDTETISIKNAAGEVRELNVVEWNAYPESLVVTTHTGIEHLFDVIKEKKEAAVAEVKETTTTEKTVTSNEEKLSQKETQARIELYESLIKRLERVLK